MVRLGEVGDLLGWTGLGGAEAKRGGAGWFFKGLVGFEGRFIG